MKKHVTVLLSRKQVDVLAWAGELFGVNRSHAIRKAITKYWSPIIKNEIRRKRDERKE